jgi:hypothetical protein
MRLNQTSISQAERKKIILESAFWGVQVKLRVLRPHAMMSNELLSDHKLGLLSQTTGARPQLQHGALAHT